MADESLLQVEAEPAWYEELMRLKDQGRVSMTPAKGLLRSNLATGAAAELANPPSLNWDEDKYLELQKDRGKNLDRFLRFDFNSMQPGETFTKANLRKLSLQGRDAEDLAYAPNIDPALREKKFQRLEELGNRPAVLYHGSPKFEGDSFDKDLLQRRDRGFHGKGIYLTTSSRYASDYADPNKMFAYYNEKSKEYDKGAQEVLPVYANIQNPIFLSNIKENDIKNIQKGLRRIIETKGEESPDGAQVLNKAINTLGRKDTPFSSRERLSQILEHVKEMTGIDMSEIFQASGYDATIVGQGNEVIIYDPRRIKSMFNQGSYNPLVDDLNANLGLGSNYARRT